MTTIPSDPPDLPYRKSSTLFEYYAAITAAARLTDVSHRALVAKILFKV
jgi:hypothetical protein